MKKISVITPSYNSEKHIKRAIESVLIQNYENFEHIIIDGASTDHTVDIIKSYTHIKYISERDNGQSDAMNKGFKMATGDIIVYLNSDDYFHKDIFHLVNEAFQNNGIDMVLGDLEIHNPINLDIKIQTPSTVFKEILEHWKNLYPLNPVQYFYKKELQEKTQFNENNHYAMDHEFLLEVMQNRTILHIDKVFGVFDMDDDSKTYQGAQRPFDYWTQENFSYIDRFLKQMPIEFVLQFKQEQHAFFEKQSKNFFNRQDRHIIKKSQRNLLDAIGNISKLYKESKNIILYGAGTQTDAIYDLIQDSIQYIVDQSIQKESIYKTHKIFNPKQLKNESTATVLVTPFNYKEEITKTLLDINPQLEIHFLEDFIKDLSNL